MTSANERVSNLLLSQAAAMELAISGEVEGILRDLEIRQREIANIAGREIAQASLGGGYWSEIRLNEAVDRAVREMGGALAAAARLNVEAAGALGTLEAAATAAILKGVIGDALELIVGSIVTPDPVMVRASIEIGLREVFAGTPVESWFRGVEERFGLKLRTAAREAVAFGHSPQRLRRTLRAELGISRSSAGRIARTTANGFVNYVRDRTLEANPQIVKAKQWSSTLDGKTSPLCIIRDRKLYTLDNKPIGHGIPWKGGPGRLHWQCRSTSIAVLKSLDEMGLSSSQQAEIAPEMRWSMNGLVPGETSFVDFLRRQPVSFQRQVLGPTRLALWRGRRVGLEDLWSESGEFIRVADLMRRYGR